jgi:hypothetical protein
MIRLGFCFIFACCGINNAERVPSEVPLIHLKSPIAFYAGRIERSATSCQRPMPQPSQRRAVGRSQDREKGPYSAAPAPLQGNKRWNCSLNQSQKLLVAEADAATIGTLAHRGNSNVLRTEAVVDGAKIGATLCHQDHFGSRLSLVDHSPSDPSKLKRCYPSSKSRDASSGFAIGRSLSASSARRALLNCLETLPHKALLRWHADISWNLYVGHVDPAHRAMWASARST